jgi:hypothetical protein
MEPFSESLMRMTVVIFMCNTWSLGRYFYGRYHHLGNKLVKFWLNACLWHGVSYILKLTGHLFFHLCKDPIIIYAYVFQKLDVLHLCTHSTTVLGRSDDVVSFEPIHMRCYIRSNTLFVLCILIWSWRKWILSWLIRFWASRNDFYYCKCSVMLSWLFDMN